MSSQSERIRALLAADESSLRSELLTLGLDLVLDVPVETWIDRSALRESILRGLTRENALLIATRHAVPAVERVAARVAGRPETVRDLLSEQGARELRAIVMSGKGPRYRFLRGAIDGDDLRQLIAPVVQQLLFSFTARLPIPGFGGSAPSGAGGLGGLGGIVGRIGKQVQRSAGQLADVGRSMFGSVIRDFSETATTDFRAALKERLQSPEGQRIVSRMRERFLDHVLSIRADDVAQDLMHLPRPEVAALSATVVGHQPALALFREILESEIDAVLDAIGSRTGRELLSELGLLEGARQQAGAALDAALRRVIQSDGFAHWLDRLLKSAEEP